MPEVSQYTKQIFEQEKDEHKREQMNFLLDVSPPSGLAAIDDFSPGLQAPPSVADI